MAMQIRIYADFNHAQSRMTFILDTFGSMEDIRPLTGRLVPGTRVTLYDEELEVDATLEFDRERGIWLGVADPETFRSLNTD